MQLQVISSYANTCYLGEETSFQVVAARPHHQVSSDTKVISFTPTKVLIISCIEWEKASEAGESCSLSKPLYQLLSDEREVCHPPDRITEVTKRSCRFWSYKAKGIKERKADDLLIPLPIKRCEGEEE